MKSRKRRIGAMLIAAMAVGVLSWSGGGWKVAAPQTARAEETQTYYFNHDFEDIPIGYIKPGSGGWNLPAPNQYWHTDIGGSGLEITYEPDGDGRSLVIGENTRLYHWLDDIPAAEKNQFVITLDVKLPNQYIQKEGNNFWIGFSQQNFMRVDWTTNGSILGSTGSKGRIKPGAWNTMAVAVDRTAGVYHAYLNGVKVLENSAIPGGVEWNSFTIQNSLRGTVSVDNVRSYAGGFIGETAAPDVNIELGKAVVYDTFDDLREQALSGTQGYRWPFANEYSQYRNEWASAPSEVSIVYDAERGSNVLKIEKSGASPSNGTFSLIRSVTEAPEFHTVAEGYTIRFDMKISDLHHNNWIFGPDLVEFSPVRQMWAEGRWYPVTMTFDKQAQTCNVYVGTQRIVSDKPWTVQDIQAFSVKSNWNNGTGNASTLMLDDLAIYPGVYAPQ